MVFTRENRRGSAQGGGGGAAAAEAAVMASHRRHGVNRTAAATEKIPEIDVIVRVVCSVGSIAFRWRPLFEQHMVLFFRFSNIVFGGRSSGLQ